MKCVFAIVENYTMDREFFLKLAYATYKVADVLPQDEEVRGNIKDTATNIVAHLLLPEKERDGLYIVKEVQRLQEYFNTAKSKQWINPENFLILEREYDKIIGLSEQYQQISASVPSTPSLSERQKKILEILRSKEKTQVWELQKVLPEVTKRTLRRDLDDLLQLNIVERQGEWNEVFYRLK